MRHSLIAEYSSYTPIGHRVLIRRVEDQVEAGGIILPQNMARTALAEAEVVAVGPKVENFQVGDHVLFHRQLAFNKINLDGTEHEIAPDDQLLATVERS